MPSPGTVHQNCPDSWDQVLSPFLCPETGKLIYEYALRDSLDAYTVLSVFGHTPRRIRPCIEIIGSHGHEQLEGRHTNSGTLYLILVALKLVDHVDSHETPRPGPFLIIKIPPEIIETPFMRALWC